MHISSIIESSFELAKRQKRKDCTCIHPRINWGGVSLAAAFVALLALLVAFCVAVPQQAHAVEKIGKGVYKLEEKYDDKAKVCTDTYKKADVTGDKKKDNIQLITKTKKAGIGSTSWYYRQTYTFKVNGKTIKTWKAQKYYATIKVVTLKNKKSYLYISSGKRFGDSKDNSALYQVKGKKLKKVASMHGILSKSLVLTKAWGDSWDTKNYLDPIKVKGNTICCEAGFSTQALGDIFTKGEDTAYGKTRSYVKLAYSKGKFKVKTSVADLQRAPDGLDADGWCDIEEDGYTAAEDIEVTKSVSSSETAFTISKGTNFKAKKMSIVKKKLYVQVKDENGNVGWIKLGKDRLVEALSY